MHSVWMAEAKSCEVEVTHELKEGIQEAEDQLNKLSTKNDMNFKNDDIKDPKHMIFNTMSIYIQK